MDGAGDGGPAHEKVMFWWTARHLENGNLVTLVSSRSSGSSYMNRVELQNGCLAEGHSNLFIPSTMNGACFNEETGKIDENKLQTNMEAAMDVYISRVSGSPCGDTVIHLHKGAESSEFQCMRKDMHIFLKRSKKKKDQLQQEKPAIYSYFQSVWDRGTWLQIFPLNINLLFFRRLSTSKVSKWTVIFRKLLGFLVVQALIGCLYQYLIRSVHGAA